LNVQLAIDAQIVTQPTSLYEIQENTLTKQVVPAQLALKAISAQELIQDQSYAQMDIGLLQEQ